MLSEVDRRIAETKKDMYEFKRDVIGELHSHIAHENRDGLPLSAVTDC